MKITLHFFEGIENPIRLHQTDYDGWRTSIISLTEKQAELLFGTSVTQKIKTRELTEISDI